MAKVLEKFISNQLFLENHHLLNDLQGEYRHGRSTDNILLYAVVTITQALDAGNLVCVAFLDLRKAFDSLDHHVLLQCLLNLRVSEWGSVMGGIRATLSNLNLPPCNKITTFNYIYNFGINHLLHDSLRP